MERLLLFFFFVVIVTVSVAQENPALDERNGFKDIILGSSVDSVKGVKLKKEFTVEGNVFPSSLHEVEHDDYSSIGEVAVRKIEIEAYRNHIYTITVFADKDPRLMKALESLYGQATYDAKNNRYFWRGKNLILTYESKGKRELKMEYQSLLVPQLMKNDKEQKIDNIADDF